MVRLLLGVGLVLAVASAAGATPQIPEAARQYRRLLVRCAHAGWGLDAPVAVLAAQIHQESAWNPAAVSRAGAEGLAQFMPSTARWLPEAAPHLPLGDVAPFTPSWALLACAAYDRWLWDRVEGATDCDRMAFALAAYNGGLGWVRRDARAAAATGCDSRRWWGCVEKANAGRSAANWRENRGYPRRILHDLAPLYEAAGWGPGVGCD